jgi:Uma2 family endonuclease
MAGRTPEHGAPAGLPKTALNAALRGRPCRVFTSDVRVRVLETDLATYPDASVVCGKLETAPDDRDAIVNPVLIVEVLSSSTAAYDRGAKAQHYRRLPSLRDRDVWELRVVHAGAPLTLAALGVELDTAALFADPLA